MSHTNQNLNPNLRQKVHDIKQMAFTQGGIAATNMRLAPPKGVFTPNIANKSNYSKTSTFALNSAVQNGGGDYLDQISLNNNRGVQQQIILSQNKWLSPSIIKQNDQPNKQPMLIQGQNPINYDNSSFQNLNKNPPSIDRSKFSPSRSGMVSVSMTASSSGNNMENIQGIAKQSANSSPLNGSIDSSEEQESLIQMEQVEEQKPTAYAWFVLFMVFAIRAVHQLHRQCIGFAFGYQGVGDRANSPKYMLSASYPQMYTYFGLISSFVFSSSYSVLGVWAGILSEKMSRKWLLGLSCILWSATTYFAGAIPGFAFFCLMRFMLGAFESACNPASYSIIADYFPPNYRSTANAIETAGSYVGGGLASFCVILIAKYGWRAMYKIIGGGGMIMGALSILLIKEPGRGVFDFADQFKSQNDTEDSQKERQLQAEIKVKDTRGPFKQFSDALADLVSNPVAKWVTIAGCFRFFETFSIVYYLPSFFQKVYPLFRMEYGLYSAAIVASMGALSTILGGLLSDRFERRSRMTKSYICSLGSLLAIPAIGLCVLNTSNFYLSLVAMGFKYLISECWMSPAITMMQSTVKPEEQGSIVSAHLFYLTVVGCFSTVLLGQVANLLGAATNPSIYGKLIFAWSIIGYVGSIPAFLKAGKLYKSKMDKMEAQSKSYA